MSKYLDYNGLLYFKNKLDNVFQGKQEKITISGILKGNGTGVVQAVPGTDYQIPLEAGVDYQVPIVFGTTYNPTTNKAATISDVNEAISHVTTFSFHICTSAEYDPITRIPTIVSPSTSTIYLVPKSTAGESNSYVEWAYISGSWEQIGETQVSIESITNSEIDALFS